MKIWQQLIQNGNVNITLPWLGGNKLYKKAQSWDLKGPNPREFGWYQFKQDQKNLKWIESDPIEVQEESFLDLCTGYLVGDRLILDGVSADKSPQILLEEAIKIYIVPNYLERFSRIKAGRFSYKGSFVFVSQEMNIGPEIDVNEAFLSRKESIINIKCVSPALDAAFNLETWQRKEVERKRKELLQKLEEEDKKRKAEEARRKLREQQGSAAGRRQLALIDFGEAARSALKISDAEYLEHRPSYNRGEMLIRFRYLNQRFECICHAETLQIVDAGICLTGASGFKHDKRLSLETLPLIIKEAQESYKLVVLRRIDDYYDNSPDSY